MKEKYFEYSSKARRQPSFDFEENSSDFPPTLTVYSNKYPHVFSDAFPSRGTRGHRIWLGQPLPRGCRTYRCPPLLTRTRLRRPHRHGEAATPHCRPPCGFPRSRRHRRRPCRPRRWWTRTDARRLPSRRPLQTRLSCRQSRPTCGDSCFVRCVLPKRKVGMAWIRFEFRLSDSRGNITTTFYSMKVLNVMWSRYPWIGNYKWLWWYVVIYLFGAGCFATLVMVKTG